MWDQAEQQLVINTFVKKAVCIPLVLGKEYMKNLIMRPLHVGDIADGQLRRRKHTCKRAAWILSSMIMIYNFVKISHSVLSWSKIK